MPAAGRLVEQAHVHAGPADGGPRWRFLLEDALRTAEFGDAGRLVVVRRLRLAGLPARPGPGQAARALEQAWAAQVRQAVPALTPGATAAPVVWFASRLEARAEWLAAWADDDRPRLAHWYWPAALQMPAAGSAVITPAVAAQVWRAARAASAPAWRRQVAAWPDVRVVTLARRWALAGVLPAPASAPEGAEALDADSADAPPEAAPEAAARAPCVHVATRIAPHAPLPAAAVRWLAAHWLAEAGESSVLPPAHGLQTIVALVPRIVAGTAPAAADGSTPVPPSSGPAAIEPPAAQAWSRLLPGPPARPVRRRAATPQPAGRTPPTPPMHLDAPALAPHPALVRLARSRPWLADGEATGHGGLLFLLNMLPALGFRAWLDGQPAGPVFVDRLFLHLLDVTGAPPDDPQRAWFDPAAAADDPRLRLWRLRLRRALRRRVRLDLGELVRRPALVTATPTHLDLVFPLDEVDLRLRRVGLDLDPGWVPWFGRIVSFHFL